MLIQAASWLPGLWPCFWGGSPGVAGSLQWALRHLELWCHHVRAWGWVSRVRLSDAVSEPLHEVHHIAREISGNIQNIPTYPQISPNNQCCVPWCALRPRLSISCVMPCLSYWLYLLLAIIPMGQVLLCGYPPFLADTDPQVLAMVRRRERCSPSCPATNVPCPVSGDISPFHKRTGIRRILATAMRLWVASWK